MGNHIFVEIHAYREGGDLANRPHMNGGNDKANFGDTVRRGSIHAHNDTEEHTDHINFEGIRGCSPGGDGVVIFRRYAEQLRRKRGYKSGRRCRE